MNDCRKQHGFDISDRISCAITADGRGRRCGAPARRLHRGRGARRTRFAVVDETLSAADFTIDGVGVSLDLSADA